MPDPVWYYARGEVERGPFTGVQIKALAHAGKLRRDDLVWKEGMENWTAAKEVAELFPGESPANESTPTNGTPTLDSATLARTADSEPITRIARDLARLVHALGWGCLWVGMSGIIVARGCESLGQAKVSRLDAAAKAQAIEQWQRKRIPIVTELESLQAKPKPSSAEQDRLRELTLTLNQLDAARSMEELHAELRLGVGHAKAEFQSADFARGLTFHGGVVFLVLSGFAHAMVGAGSDRWLGIGILLVVAFTTLTVWLPR